jgi:hypothetical protein
MRAVIALPIKPSLPSGIKPGCILGDPELQLLRQVAHFGNAEYAKAKNYTLIVPDEGIRFGRSSVLVKAGIKCAGLGANMLLCIFDVKSVEEVRKLRRLSLAANRDQFEAKLNVRLEGDNAVYGLAIIETPTDVPKARDGLLEIPRSNNTFIFDVLYSQTLCAIAIERELLETATGSVINPGIFNLRARRNLASLKHWLFLPSSDSTRLFEEIVLLRKSIMLDERYQQVTRSLEQHSRKLHFTAAALISTVGLAATLIGPVNFGEGLFPVVAKALTCLGIGAVFALLTWMVAGA